MHCILQKAKKSMNQTEKSGSSFMVYGRKTLSMLVLGLSLFLIGSCNESASIFSEIQKPVNLGELNKDDLIRYGYKIQAALTYKPEDLKELRRADLKLALATPDLNRKEGGKNVWQYRTKSCVLDVYWQQNKPQAKIAHYEFRERRSIFEKATLSNDPAAWHCMQSLIEQRREIVQKGFEETYADLSLNAHKS
jgi:hypothetical protein